TQRLLYGNRLYDDVIGFADAFAAESNRLGAARGVAFATTLRGEAELLCGRLGDADRDLEEGTHLHRAIDAPTGESFAAAAAGFATAGQPLDARRCAAQLA